MELQTDTEIFCLLDSRPARGNFIGGQTFASNDKTTSSYMVCRHIIPAKTISCKAGKKYVARTALWS